MLEETDKYSDKGADNALFSYAKEKRKHTASSKGLCIRMVQRTSEITRIMTPNTTALISNYVLQRHLAVKASPHSWYLTPYMQNLFPFVPAITL